MTGEVQSILSYLMCVYCALAIFLVASVGVLIRGLSAPRKEKKIDWLAC